MTEQRFPTGSRIAIGQLFAARFEILQIVGDGAISDVFKARDSLSKEIVALKILRPSLAQHRPLLQAYRQELSTLQRWRHNNIVRINEIGEHQDSMFISMELLEGRSVARLLTLAKMTPVGFFGFFVQFCDALSSLHAQGIIHRSIQPSNLISDRAGQIKLMDFSAARDLAALQSLGLAPVPNGYQPPEFLQGRPVGPAYDIYSCGALFFALLTGRNPLADLAPAQRAGKLDPGLSRELAGISRTLAAVVERCLQLAPGDRFASVEQMRQAALRSEGSARRSKTLADLLRDDPTESKDVVPAVIAVLERLSAIHEAKLGHPPLAPSSIRLGEDGRAEIDATKPLPGGTPVPGGDAKYSSPGLFEEILEDAVARDVYVVGFLFYEILLGRKLFAQQFAATAQSRSDLEWFRWHADTNQRAKPLAEVVDRSPKALSNLISKMMEKNPEIRPRDLKELRTSFQSLEDHMSKTVLFAAIPRTAVKKSAAPRPHRKAWVAVLVGVVVAAGILGILALAVMYYQSGGFAFLH